MVELSTVNRTVIGSSPIATASQDYFRFLLFGSMTELADESDLKSDALVGVWVRIPLLLLRSIILTE